jgi:flavin reductase (DIM6/NTAB) family NADH-FMN oxidoreductase RutF
MKDVNYLQFAEKNIKSIKSPGAFLVVKSDADDRINTMTIGWVSLGFMWGKPIMTVMVRKSRFTYQLIENASSFTVSIPERDLRKALAICGTESGKKFNKFEKCNLVIQSAKTVNTPIIKIPGQHYECKIVYKSEMKSKNLCQDYLMKNYPNHDLHALYFGEIVEYYKLN